MCVNVSTVVLFGISICILQMKPVSFDDSLERSFVDNHPKGIFGYAWRRYMLVSTGGVPEC